MIQNDSVEWKYSNSHCPVCGSMKIEYSQEDEEFHCHDCDSWYHCFIIDKEVAE